jgi:DNA-directed RNA polymerase specialized sigma24 family protein
MATNDEDLLRLARCLATLPANHAIVVRFRLVGYSSKEIADFFGWREGTVRDWFTAANAALKRCWGEGD